MGYKTNITKEFKSKGFIDGLTLISTEKRDNGEQYDIQEILNKLTSDGEEVEFSVKKKEQFDEVDTDTDEE